MKTLILVLLVFILAPPPAHAHPPLIKELSIYKDGFSGPWWMDMDAAGNLYVLHASGFAKYTNDGTLLDRWSGEYSDLAIAPNGEIFANGATVVRMAPDGSVIGEWSACISDCNNPIIEQNRPGIAIDDDGFVYITDSGNKKVLKFTAEGELVHQWSTESGNPSVPYAIDIGPEGNVFVADRPRDNGRIRKFSPDGVQLATWTDRFPDGAYLDPKDVAIDRWGNIYIADERHDLIVVWDKNGNKLGWFDTPDRENTLPSDHPRGVAVDEQGNIFVADSAISIIQKFAPFGPSFSPIREAAVMLHVAVPDTVDMTCGMVPTSIEEIVTEGRGAPKVGGNYYVYLLGSPELFIGSQSAGITGFQLGIDYHKAGNSMQGIHIHDWFSCGSLEFPQTEWPEPQSGNTITWSISGCSKDEIVVAGYFYLSAYSPSRMSAIPFPPTGRAKVANCLGAEMGAQTPLSPIRLGWVALEEAGGCNPLIEPCYATTPVKKTTWGSLKILFGDP